MEFEDDLRRALRPVEPPEGLEQKVLARIAGRQAHPSSRAPERRAGMPGVRLRATAAAAASLLVLGGAWYYQERTADQRAARVAREARMALQIASEKLVEVQRRVNRPAGPE